MALTFNHQTNDISNATGTVSFNGVAVGGDNTPANSGSRGIFGGMSRTTTLEYITISTTGNVTDFGDLTKAKANMASCSNGTRGVWAGGFSNDFHPLTGDGTAYGDEEIDYITFASTGNASDFGDLTLGRYLFAGVSDGSRGCFGGGQVHPAQTGNVGGSGNSLAGTPIARDEIDYVTIDTTGNATDFGDLVNDEPYGESACADFTRGVFKVINGYGSLESTYNYITIQTTGNATLFGDVFEDKGQAAGCADSTRGVFATNYFSNTIEYITIQTTGNGTDFGNLTQSRGQGAAVANDTRGVFAGGNAEGSSTNVMDYVTIQTTGNATDFGDLSATSNSGPSGSSGT